MEQISGLHGFFIALLLLLQLGLRSCQEPLESFAPLNLEVHPDRHHQRVLVEWDIQDRVYSSSFNFIFHIQVARSQKKNIIHDWFQEYNSPSLSGSGKPFSWLWDSQLPLECDSHSFRIRSSLLRDSLPSEQHWSAWTPWETIHGKNEENRKNAVIYPSEKVVLEGSNVTFCCLPGQSEEVREMTYKMQQHPRLSEQMKTESFVITVENVSMSRSDGDNVICQVNSMDIIKRKGTVLIVSKPPDEPKNFSCETNDLQRLQCSWKPGPIYNFYKQLGEKYLLHEWFSGKIDTCSRHNCTWPITKSQKMYNFTLNVKNRMGEKSIQAMVDLPERVRPVAPTNLVATFVNATDVELTWSLNADYTSLVLHCQTDQKEGNVIMTVRGRTSQERYSVGLTQLQPYTKYDLRVRCMAESSLAGWSNWSEPRQVQTLEAAPSTALDVWREIQNNENGRMVTLYWKHPPGFKANGKISHYNIKWWPIGDNTQASETRVSAQWASYRIKLGGEAHAISVTAQNAAGVSPAAEIKVPVTSGNGNTEVNTERTHGRNGEINVMWSQVPAVSGYVVEWCNSPRSPNCDLQWRKYNSHIHRDVIHSAFFQSGVRYNFRIYGSKEDGDHLLGKLTGYTEELVSSKKPKVEPTKIDAHSLTLDWSPYPVDETQEGFVTGYTIYVKTMGRNCEMDATDGHITLDGLEVCRIFINDPKIMNATIRQLRPNTEYQVAVVAVTGGGETEKEFVHASTQSDAGAMIMSILLPVIIVSVLAVILLIAGCWKRAWLKETCYPNIPKANKSQVLSFSSPKGPTRINILPDVSSVHQKVEPVYVVTRMDLGQDLKDTRNQQTGVTYSTIQRPTNTSNSVAIDDMYLPDEHGSPLNDTVEELLYKPQPPSYLEFFNENYMGTSDDSYEEDLGYKPQMGLTQLHKVQSKGYSQDAALESGHQLRATSLSTTENEPVSPTSVNSTSFILKD